MIKNREMLKSFCFQTGGVMFERYDGSIAPKSLDDPGSVTRNITDAEIYLGDDSVWDGDYGRIPSDNLITEFNLFYKPIIPNESWAGRIYCRRSGLTDNGNLSSEYAGYLQDVYDATEKDNQLTVYAPWIRDEDTAKELAKLYIQWRVIPLATMVLDCKLSALDIEYGDIIGVTASVIPSDLSSKRWLVTGMRTSLPVAEAQPGVRLELLEVGGSAVSEIIEWVDQDGDSSDTEYTDQDGDSTDAIYQDVE